jgi:hypothetical protein
MPKNKVSTYSKKTEGKGAVGKAKTVLGNRQKQLNCLEKGGSWDASTGTCTPRKEVKRKN